MLRTTKSCIQKLLIFLWNLKKPRTCFGYCFKLFVVALRLISSILFIITKQTQEREIIIKMMIKVGDGGGGPGGSFLIEL